MSKLWSFLFKIDYVLSTAYLASVVLIEADVPILAPAKRVLRADLTIGPFRQPVITQVAAAAGAAAPITAQSAIVLTGINLTANAGAITQVVIGGVAQTVIPAVPTQITLTLPAGLPAGPQTAQVVQPLLLGNPAVVHPGTGSTSGIAAFVLQPVVAQTGSPGSYEISVQPAAASPPGFDLVATLVPEVLAGQEVVLQLLPQAPAAQPLLFDGGQLAADSSTVSVSIGTPPPGTYIAQLLIDGAPTPMVYNVSGVPIAPSVTI